MGDDGPGFAEDLKEEIGPEHFYDSVHAGVDAFLTEPQQETEA